MPRSRNAENNNSNRGLFSKRTNHKRRAAKADDSIIRGAAIIRNHIQRLDSGTGDASPQQAQQQSSRKNHNNKNIKPSGSRATQSTSSYTDEEEEEDVSNFSDPFDPKHKKKSQQRQQQQGSTRARPVSPDGRDANHHYQSEDSDTFGFDSGPGSAATFGSQGKQIEWANRALNQGEEQSTLSARSNQPDTDPCDPVIPQRKRSSHKVGGAVTATYSLVKPIVSYNQEDDTGSSAFDFGVERDYSEDDDDDEDDICASPSYLPKDIQENLARSQPRGSKQQHKTSKSESQQRQARILQLVTTNQDDPRSSPKKGTSSTGGSPQQHQQQQQRRPRKSPPKACSIDHVPSPLSVEYSMLLQDPAFVHAQQAGHLWQSLVGFQIRFPTSWWNGTRAPPMGLDEGEHQAWQYYGRYSTVHPGLKRYVKHRSAPGRLLLHIVVQDLVTWIPVQDIVVGCIDPNSRGIRKTAQASGGQNDRRELWLAVRKRTDSISVIDSLLTRGRSLSDQESKGPLGPDQRITNGNVRAVFGEKPPVETIFVHESTLYERLVVGKDLEPSFFLVQEFVFS